jgi:hypothetical protein
MEMAQHELGHAADARTCYARALRWLRAHQDLSAQFAKELAALRTEAEAVLDLAPRDLPVDVFAPN